jgi:hypothetical protein
VTELKRGRRRTFTWIAITAGAVAVSAALIAMIWNRVNWIRKEPIETIQITGAVLRQNEDPKKQSPIANAEITATGGLLQVDAKSDSSGLFQFSVRQALRPEETVTLKFEHAEYKPLEITRVRADQLYVVRMEPVVPEPQDEHKPVNAEKPLPSVPIKDVRVRYTVKNQNTMNVGSLAKQFEVVNKGNVPCAGKRPCSPDGKWKAASGSLSLDAEGANQFRNVRVTCIAGPCPFTTIKPGDLSRPSRVINISVLNWSDTASFLVEAEVTRTAETDTIRRSYPTIIGQTMTFALPATAEGPTVEANVNGEEVVFPLGPKLLLSWATCSVEIVPGQNKTYRCELKTGYTFPQ